MSSLKSALIVYHSSTGNTRKVAYAIKDGLENEGLTVDLKKPQEAVEVDFYGYDLVCVGSPSIEWQPAKPMVDLLKAKLNLYRGQGKIKACAPKLAGKTMRQYFEHFGFNILGEWYVPSEFHGREDMSTQGRLGDIKGKPTADELGKIKKDAQQIAKSL